jgi:hypothetical protein
VDAPRKFGRDAFPEELDDAAGLHLSGAKRIA